MTLNAGLISLAIGVAALLASGPAEAGDASGEGNGHSVERVLRAMDNTPTAGHPDQFYEFRGMHAYVAGDYRAAMADFRRAARYADKLSQLSIGLMYLHGQGVAPDRVAAFAWTAIAAERQYPQFLATRDEIWATLGPREREAAKLQVADLYAMYGDRVAKPRMAKVLRRAATHRTGSLLGFNTSGVSILSASQWFRTSPPPRCGADTVDGTPMVGCGNIYVDWRWDPAAYFPSRDGAWRGTVRVGAIETTPGATSASPPPAGGPSTR